MKKIILIGAFLLGAGLGECYSVQEPVLDFGSVTYSIRRGVFSTLTLPASGSVTPSGQGNFLNQTGGSNGTVTVSGFSTWETLIGYNVELETNNVTSAQTFNTSCGSVTVQNFVTTDGTSATAKANRSGTSFPIGATLTLNSFTATGECTAQASVPSTPLRYKVGSLTGSWANIPVQIRFHVTPYMSFSHDTDAALNFGSICAYRSAQTLTVTPAGGTTSSGLFCPVSADVSADSFTFEDPTNAPFTVVVPASVTLSNGRGGILTVTNLTPSCTSCTVTGGSKTVTIGGTLQVPGGSQKGDYEGTYTVSVTY